ncbi:hypothetical protein SRHO_G00346470 [Serrasalmus rhombeus]
MLKPYYERETSPGKGIDPEIAHSPVAIAVVSVSAYNSLLDENDGERVKATPVGERQSMRGNGGRTTASTRVSGAEVPPHPRWLHVTLKREAAAAKETPAESSGHTANNNFHSILSGPLPHP